jgi:hypothetical protein
MTTTYHCIHCEATFEHPDVEECETVDGHCAHLVRAGWKPVRVRVSLAAPMGEQDRHIFTTGGWICPKSAALFVTPRPAYKRRVRRRNYRNHDRELS